MPGDRRKGKAMQLSSNPTTRQTQLTAIKTYVEANHSVNGSGVYDQSTADAMNALASVPLPFWVWKSNANPEDTGMAVDLSEVGGLTTANSSRLQVSFQIRPNGFTPSKQSDRALFGSVFSAAGGVITRTAIIALFQRKATIAEKVLATGVGTQAVGLNTDGSNTSGSPAILGDSAEGEITLPNLIEAAGVSP